MQFHSKEEQHTFGQFHESTD